LKRLLKPAKQLLIGIINGTPREHENSPTAGCTEWDFTLSIAGILEPERTAFRAYLWP